MQIFTADNALRFIKGGNAIFTLVSLPTGKRYTYRVRSKDSVWFAEVLTGPENGSDYQYIGHFNRFFGLNAGRKGNPGHPAFAALDWMLLCLGNGRMPATAEFWHEGKCARCGRRLTTPRSIETGLGPECEKKAS